MSRFYSPPAPSPSASSPEASLAAANTSTSLFTNPALPISLSILLLATVFVALVIKRWYTRGEDGMTGPERVAYEQAIRYEMLHKKIVMMPKPHMWDVCVANNLNSKKKWCETQPLSATLASTPSSPQEKHLQISTLILMPSPMPLKLIDPCRPEEFQMNFSLSLGVHKVRSSESWINFISSDGEKAQISSMAV